MRRRGEGVYVGKLLFLLLAICVSSLHAEEKSAQVSPAPPAYTPGEWAEWKFTLMPPVAKSGGSGEKEQAPETREGLLDAESPGSFHLRLTVLAKEGDTYQLRAHLYHQEKVEVSVLSASPQALLDKLPLEHGNKSIVSRQEESLPGSGEPSLLTITEITPEGGSPYLVKRWEVAKLSLGPARVEFPHATLSLVGHGSGEQPEFPISTVSSPEKSSKPVPSLPPDATK